MNLGFQNSKFLNKITEFTEKLFTKDKLKEASILLDKSIKNEGMRDSIIGLQQELSYLKQQNLKGIIDNQEKTLRRNQIRVRLLDLLKGDV